MPSLLTRRVFRQLTYSLLHTDGSATIRPAIQCDRHVGRPNWHAVPPCQTRALFGLSRKKRKPTLGKFKPGLELMMVCKERLKLQERPPPPDELVSAFIDFFRSHEKFDGGVFPIEDAQLAIVKPTFLHLKQHHNGADGFNLSDENLRTALNVLRSGSTKMHREMATLLFEELLKRRRGALETGSDTVPLHVDLAPYIWILCQNNGALLARDLLKISWQDNPQDLSTLPEDFIESRSSQWGVVLRGLIRERRNSEVDKTVEIMRQHHVTFDSKLHQTVVTFYAYFVGDIDLTKKWYHHPIADSGTPTSFTDTNVLKLCIQKKEMEFGKAIFERLIQRNPEDRASWNIILQWCAAMGRGVDEIEKMMNIMAKRNQHRSDLQPGMDTINALMEHANANSDPYTAERYYALGQKWGFEPNAQTFLLQLKYRLDAKDLSGALVAYNSLQSEAPPDEEDIPYINKLIVALVSQMHQRYDAIMGLVEDLRQRRAVFYPETIAALALLHINCGEMQDYSDLMTTYVHNYSEFERHVIRDALLDVVFSKEIDEDRAWETYNVLQTNLRESLDQDIRVRIMQNFFDRGRGDMGLHTFGHMRKDSDRQLRPSLDIYCLCLEGIARTSNYAAAQLVHNMMTMDEYIEPNTKIKNALMLAYSGVGAPNRAKNIWEDIINSREGPTYSSIIIALQACEGMGPHGEDWAHDVWSKLKRMDIEVTRQVFAAYVGAIAAAGASKQCWALLENAEKECGNEVDALMLGSFYNAEVGIKDPFIETAKKDYPAAYEELQKCKLITKITYDPDLEEQTEESIVDEITYYEIGHLGRDVRP